MISLLHLFGCIPSGCYLFGLLWISALALGGDLYIYGAGVNIHLFLFSFICIFFKCLRIIDICSSLYLFLLFQDIRRELNIEPFVQLDGTRTDDAIVQRAVVSATHY